MDPLRVDVDENSEYHIRGFGSAWCQRRVQRLDFRGLGETSHTFLRSSVRSHRWRMVAVRCPKTSQAGMLGNADYGWVGVPTF